ncbi:MAG: 50S ribosomal protein L5 [Candidatus Anstonellales archaeon]
MDSKNPMQEVCIEKVTLNMGVGSSGEPLQNAKILLERLSGRKAISTKARTRNPTFKIKRGDEIGAKVTLRGKEAYDFLKKAFIARGNKLSSRSIDGFGNFSFGIPEYIEFPGAKYDPKIGILGFEVAVTMKRRGGVRIARRKRCRAKLPKRQHPSPQETTNFLRQSFGVSIE